MYPRGDVQPLLDVCPSLREFETWSCAGVPTAYRLSYGCKHAAMYVVLIHGALCLFTT
jgi:hypothetical protein